MHHTVQDLQEELSRRSGRRVLLYLTDNRRSMVSARGKGPGVLEVRLQRIFLESPPEVVKELGDLLAGKKTPRTALRRFVDSRQDDIPPPPEREAPRRTSPARQASAHHDITAYARQLNATYLGGRSKAEVLWGRRNTTRSRRSIRFACYDQSRDVIIMNRKLDSPDIPAYFVEFVLFHEMLHEVLGIGIRADGKRDIHGSLFKLMESTFPDYDRALRFEKELCKRLGML